MNTDTLEIRARKKLTKRLVVNCMRTPLEPLHAGHGPVSKTGDGSDITVTDAEGQTFTFDEISRISDAEMKELMKTVTDRVFTFLSHFEDAEFMEMMSGYDASTAKWDTPKIDQGMLKREYLRKLKGLEAQEKP